MEGPNVAIYLDFENLAISAETVYPAQSLPLQIAPLVEYASTKGTICRRQAYADWSRDLFARYQNMLIEQGFELIHLPGTHLQGKNGADVRLAIDVMEHLEQLPSVQTLVIGSGDTDFIPLIQRVQSRNKSVVVVGFEHSVAQLVRKNSEEFKSMETLIREYRQNHLNGSSLGNGELGRKLLLQFLENHDVRQPILMSQLKQQLLRLDPQFSEKRMGYGSFKQFLNSYQGDMIERIDTAQETLPMIYFTPYTNTPTHQVKEKAAGFLSKKIRYRTDVSLRMQITGVLIQLFKVHGSISMNQLFEEVYEELKDELSKSDIRKYINTLFTGGAFEISDHDQRKPLLSRALTLKPSLVRPETLDAVYIKRVGEILQRRYTHLTDSDILDLLF